MNKSTLLLKEETAAQEASVGVRINTRVRHVGLYAKDPSAMAEFYRDVLGMQIVGGSSADGPIGSTAFLSSRPEEESHEIAFSRGKSFRTLRSR